MKNQRNTVRTLLGVDGTTAAISLAVAIGGFFLLHQTSHPPCCDAEQYLGLAKLYASEGIVAKSTDASLRTYLYPLLLSYLYAFSSFTHLPFALILLLVQFGLHIYVTSKYMQRISADRPLLKLICGALILNLYLYPFFSLTLTDSVYTSLIVIWLYAILADTGSACPDNRIRLRLFLPALLSSAVLAVRPAGLWVVVITVAMYGWTFVRLTGLRPRLYLLAGLITALFLPLFPQIYINLLNYGRPTPLPVFDLGAAQVQWGLELIKYATNLSGGDPRLTYSNPFYTGGSGITWYFENPLRAMAGITMKIVGAFDYDYLFPYIYDAKPWYRWVSGSISLGIFTLGLAGIVVHAIRPDSCAVRIGPRYFPLLCVTAWAGLTVVSAVELRFALPMYALLVPFAFGHAATIYRLPAGGRRAVWISGMLTAYLGLLAVARFVRAQNPFY